MQILISYTEDLEAWFFYTKNRNEKNIDHKAWEYLMKYKSTPTTRNNFLAEMETIKNYEDFMKYFNFRESDLLANQNMTKEIIKKEITEGVIIKAFDIAVKNRTTQSGLLIRAFNKIKHHYLILDSSGPEVIIRDDAQILKVDINIEEAKKLLNTIELIKHGIHGIITTLLYEICGFIKTFGLSKKDKDYFLNKKISGNNDPIQYIINANIQETTFNR